MIAPAVLVMFVAAVMLLLLSPGPNMVFVLAHGAACGARGGVAAALGIGLADVVFTGLAAAGVTAALDAWPAAFTAIRYAGAAWLTWLAWQELRRGGRLRLSDVPVESMGRIAARAALNSLLNPKALLFFVVLLPQFADARRGPVLRQLLVLGGVLAVTGVAFHALLGAAAATLRHRLGRTLVATPWPSRALAVVLVSLAVRLLGMPRPA